MAFISCPVCGRSIRDDSKVCPYCKSQIVPEQNDFARPVYNSSEPPKSNKKGLIFAGIGIAAVSVLVTVCITTMINSSKQTPPANVPAVGGVVSENDTSANKAPSDDIASDNNNASPDNNETEVTPPSNNSVAPPENNETEVVPPSSNNVLPPSNNTPPSETVVPEKTEYNVAIKVQCEKNTVYNKYDVDILIDDKNIATHKHGETKTYNMVLSKGTHEIEFRICGQKTFSKKPIYDPGDVTTFREMYISVSDDETYSYYVELKNGNSIKVTQK